MHQVSQKSRPIKLPDQGGSSTKELIGSQGKSIAAGGYYHSWLDQEIHFKNIRTLSADRINKLTLLHVFFSFLSFCSMLIFLFLHIIKTASFSAFTLI